MADDRDLDGEEARAAAMQKMAMDAVGFAAQLMTPHAEALGAFVKAEQESHSYMHIVDPTLYRRMITDKNFLAQVKLAKAGLAFILAVQQVKAELVAAGLARPE